MYTRRLLPDEVVVARLRAAGCVFAEEEAAILASSAATAQELDALVTRRATGEPLEQVVGWASFCGLRIAVDPGVFVPRRRSEFLVSVATGVAPPAPVIVDLCCGTGALGVAVAVAADGAGVSELHAADLDPAAVKCARRNVARVGGQAYLGDLFGALPVAVRGRVDVLICNAPYVPTTEIAFMPAEARDHEALMALDGGTDGLAILRRVADSAAGWLAAGGTLLVETSEGQAPAMAAAMDAGGLAARTWSDDESGATVVAGTRLPMSQRVSAAQRQGRLAERQLLGAPVATVAAVAESLVALHATDPATVYLSARARSGCTAEQVDAALYAERALVRMLGMRRTVFVVPASLAGVVQAACTDDVAARLRRQLVKDLDGGGVGDGDAGGWLRAVEDGVLRSLAARGGGASGAQLSADEPRLRTQLNYAPDKAYGGAAYITSRVLVLIAAEGRTIRGHRRGGWSSGQFEWFLPEAWLDEGGAGSGRGDGLAAGAARTELARRWLAAFGPAPVADLRWWAGWTGAQTKAALAGLPVTEVDLDGQPGIALADDLDFPAGPPAGAALLPALDPTPMGWQSRSWYLGAHTPRLFDRTGNIGPSVWWSGRVVGGWAQRATGEVVYRLLEDIGADAEAAVTAQAGALEAWLGAGRVTPRFRTPLERELSA